MCCSADDIYIYIELIYIIKFIFTYKSFLYAGVSFIEYVRIAPTRLRKFYAATLVHSYEKDWKPFEVIMKGCHGLGEDHHGLG